MDKKTLDLSHLEGNGGEAIYLEFEPEGEIFLVLETECGCNSGSINLFSLLNWVKRIHPEWMEGETV
jgi:hypothetical protein